MALVLGKLIFRPGAGQWRSRNGSGIEDGRGRARHFAVGLEASESEKVSAEEGAEEGVVHEEEEEQEDGKIG